MTFTLVRLWCGKEAKGTNRYRSLIQLGSRAISKEFINRQEMEAILVGILATQKRNSSLVEVLKIIDANGSFDFTGENRQQNAALSRRHCVVKRG